MNQPAPNPHGYDPAPGQAPAPGGYAPAPGQAPAQAPAPGGYAPAPAQAPAPGGYAPAPGQAPAPGGYAPAPGQAPAPAHAGYGPSQPPAPAGQQQPPGEDLSNVRIPLKKGAPGRADIDWDRWQNVPEQQTFNLPNTPSEVQMCPHGQFQGQVIFAKMQRKKQEWGGGLSIRIQVGFTAVINGQSYPYKAWTSISADNDTTLGEFVTAACPWKTIGVDDFGPNDALGRHVLLTIGYGTGNWAQTGKDPRVVIQGYKPVQAAAGGAAPAPAPVPAGAPAPAGGYGQTYGGPAPAHQQGAHVPQGDIPF